ncbi:hypothetical protein KGA66_21635 [Actinocrinis puniceicyclus]|uniref:Uncharacterized protein n=1 Tax=Actinocrinis puniceicyclus TaxID=977794 RepID=A0A8J7WNI4_9ACTN|nr:hypothetical protein [Actinocrinis puniceicyclus]MBS2965668.1 hypothetical protein [Actinocrinis puniceicyclus]
MSIVSMAEWRKVPIGPDAARWSTRTQCVTVLIVVDTVTSGQRLLEVARLFEADFRVQVVFTSPVGGVFDNGVGEFLAGIGALVVPWRQAVDFDFGLAVAAGHEGIHELHAPVVLLPHGAGFNKRVSAGQRGRVVAQREVYGLGAQWLVRDGALIPSALVLAHEEERARLALGCPQALSCAVVVGDPCYDRIEVSRPRRYAYRDALGVGPGRRLVTVASTWGPSSLLGRVPDLPGRLVAQLPPDEYQVIVLAHPNAWFGHGRWQITAWLTGALREGLGLVPPEADWRAVLAASDVVIGDHGSVSLYATAAGAPVAFAGQLSADVDRGSPLGELAAFAPRLSSRRPFAAQLERLGPDFRRDDYARVAGRITSKPGRFAPNMRRLLYRHLGLDEPAVASAAEPAPLPTLIRYGSASSDSACSRIGGAR